MAIERFAQKDTGGGHEGRAPGVEIRDGLTRQQATYHVSLFLGICLLDPA